MAAEFASSAAANAAGNVATEYASPYVSYFFCFGKIVEEFKKKRKLLELKKDRVKNDVDVAIRQTEVIEKDVQEWLEKAEKELKETQKLEAEIERKKCFDWCPTWGWRYCLSKKVARKTPYINELLQRSEFQRVGIRPPLQGIEFFPSKDFKSSESSNLAFDGIIRALNTDGVNMIGLYGMPGVGKTTLAKEVGKQAKEQKLFDNVVMVTMSQNPNISNTQDKIAGSLGLKFEASFEEGKAEELWRRLKDVKKILIIIDDVWNEFKLQTVGIPFGVEHEGCKILLTTRLQHVCVRMRCQEKFQLNILFKDEAWALFKDNAGLQDVSSTLNDVAKEIASESKGLPLAIVTIGKALNGASLEEWKAVNQRFKESRLVDNEDVCEDIYKCLQVSYDCLRGDNIRSWFLLCSLFPEDCLINIELLIMFGIGHGLFSHIYPIEGFRMEIRQVLRKLQQSGLLMNSDDNDDDSDVYMHDVVRDFSHWITVRGENMFMVKDGLMEWPTSESIGCCTAIVFWKSYIKFFPEKLKFSKLKILVFEGKKFVEVPSAFVKGMEELRILYLKNVIFSLEVFQFIRNLRSLYFIDCKLENILSLKNLENLEILKLVDTNIYKLPEELVALRGLKSLHFYGTKEWCDFPPNILSRLTSLQELHVMCENNANLWELNSLSRLTALSLRVYGDHQCFQENFVFPKVQSYRIVVNEFYLGFVERKRSCRTLEINGLSSSLSAFKELFCNVEMLALQEVMKHKNIIPSIAQEGLNELTFLHMLRCGDMKYLIDTTGENGSNSAIFSNLEELKISYMHCLKELCHGPPPVRFLQRLKDVTIENCERLKVIFQMDAIFEKEEISHTSLLSNLTRLHLESLSELESIWKLQASHQYHASLQGLKDVRILRCNKLESIFSTCIARSLLHLQQLNIYECKGLKEVFNFPQEIAELEVPPLSNLTSLELEKLPKLKWIWKGPTVFLDLQNLKIMKVDSCMKLAYLFTTPLAQSLVHLEQLQIWSCHSLEHVIMEEAEDEGEIVSDKLQHHYSHGWPKLKIIDIFDCRSLKYVFPTNLAQGLPSLESVEIDDCSQLKQIFNMMEQKDGRPQQDIVLQSLQILKLVNLENLDSFSLVSPSLEKFNVRNCPQLTRFESHQGVLQAEFKDGIKKLLCNAKNVTMGATMYPKNLIPNVDPEGLNEATFLTLKNDEELECLIDTTDQGYVPTVAFSNLEELVIKQMAGLKILCNGPFPKGSLHNLKKMRVIGCGQLQELYQMEEVLHDMEENEAPLLSNLTSLELESLPKLKWIWKGPSHYLCLQSLKVVKISSCSRLKYLFSPSLAQSLVLLQQLKIEDCHELEHITTELEIGDSIESDGGHLRPPLLPQLTTLEISGCPRLRYVFQIPVGQVFPLLKSVSIANSPQLKHVFNVAKVENGVDCVAIGLPCLQDLVLENLVNLDCFCSENYPIASPCLEKLNLVYCPGLEIFSIQQVNEVVQLKELKYFEFGLDNWCDAINCQRIFQIQVGCFFSRIEDMHLSCMHQGPIKIAKFQYLKNLKVFGCIWMKSLFSITIVRNLSQLESLCIECCKELEEIIEMDQSSSEDRLQPISLHSLQYITIESCNNLKRLLPISVTCSLSKLGGITIIGASKLEQIFGYQGELNVEDDKMGIAFPNLGTLILEQLPSLKSFAPMGYYFRFPLLHFFRATKCFKLTTSFSMSKLPANAKTKAPQPVKNNTEESLTTVEEIVDDQSTCNDINWFRFGRIPIFMKLGETKIMLHEEMENIQT